MNKLTCDVSSCKHNDDCLCALNKIKVEGPGASAKDQTCCSSFAKQDSSASNSCGCGCASTETTIDCKAESCIHNKNCKCEANSVEVGCMCSTPTVMSETECCTYKMK